MTDVEPVSTDPARHPRLLAVVAHPDDETFGLGSLLLHAEEAGWDTTVLCATRGEAGDVAPGAPPGDLGAIREAETRDAAAVLGVTRVRFLDLVDSGMSGPAGPATLVGAPLDTVLLPIRDHIETLRPSLVVTLDASDGHRDHERVRDATVVAVDTASWVVDRLYLHCLPQTLMRRWVEHMAATDPTWEHLRGEVPGTPEDQVTTTIDSATFLGRREDAMRRHASQRSPFDGLPEDLRRDFLTTERLQRLRPPWRGGPRESALAVPDVSRPGHCHGRSCWWNVAACRWAGPAHDADIVISDGC